MTDLVENEFNRDKLRRRKSDSNLLTQSINSNKRERLSQQPFSFKRQLSHLSETDKPADTFYDALEIKFHHSVGSMSISPASRDVVLAGYTFIYIFIKRCCFDNNHIYKTAGFSHY